MPSNKKLKILFVTPEVIPFCKSGGVADVSSALPQNLIEQGHEVRILVPKYGTINERKFKIHWVVRLKDISTQIGKKFITYSLRSSFLVGKKARIQLYLVDNEKYFSSKRSLYYNSKGEEYADNSQAFTLLAKSVFDLIELLGWVPDIIHCNDWQCGLIPVYLKTVYNENKIFENIKTIFTIHNMATQGEYNKNEFPLLDLPESLNSNDGILHKSKINFLKAGIKYADAVNTVSETYAKEISTEKDTSYGLIDVINSRKRKIMGIVNGIDTFAWNPSKDKLIEKKYTSKTIANKEINKKVLLEKFSLEYKEGRPVIGIISKLTKSKGMDILRTGFKDLMKMDVNVILLGTGESEYHSFFEDALMDYNDKFSCYLGYDDKLAHLIEAGSDMLLMPSKQEPCGLNQMYSLVYGTIPIVRKTGGLSDIVKNFDEKKIKGNGFVFEKFTAREMIKEVKRAVSVFTTEKETWEKLISKVMEIDFSWDKSTNKYVKLYQKTLK